MKISSCFLVPLLLLAGGCASHHTVWEQLSSREGDLSRPNGGGEQTCAVTGDFNGDGVTDFAIGERTRTPSFVLYLRTDSGWARSVIDPEKRAPEAGACVADIDGDGDADIVAGNDYSGNEVWWYENPSPYMDRAWKRHIIKRGGANKHHDIYALDIDGDGRQELFFWNQGAHCMYLARIPDDPCGTWTLKKVYAYADTAELPPRARYKFNTTNEHEGFASSDIDGDGREDLVGGGMWFKYAGADSLTPHPVDEAYHYSCCAAGQLVEGGRPEVVLAVGDGEGPLNMYEWDENTEQWTCRTLADSVDNAHTLLITDFDGDGHADVWYAEMRLGGGNADARNVIMLGNGKGDFPRTITVSEGIDNHESKMADLDGDGDPDILGKGYNHLPGNLHIWLNNGTGRKRR